MSIVSRVLVTIMDELGRRVVYWSIDFVDFGELGKLRELFGSRIVNVVANCRITAFRLVFVI